MSLSGKFWLTPDGEIEIPYSEHVDFAIAAMLLLYGRQGENPRGSRR